MLIWGSAIAAASNCLPGIEITQALSAACENSYNALRPKDYATRAVRVRAPYHPAVVVARGPFYAVLMHPASACCRRRPALPRFLFTGAWCRRLGIGFSYRCCTRELPSHACLQVMPTFQRVAIWRREVIVSLAADTGYQTHPLRFRRVGRQIFTGLSACGGANSSVRHR